MVPTKVYNYTSLMIQTAAKSARFSVHFTHMYSFPADLQKGINIWLRVTCDLNF